MSEKKSKRCKQGHPIGYGKIILLSHIVGVCDNCGHRYLYSELPATYSKDKRNLLGERFHVYNYVSWLVCGGCHTAMVSIQVKCKTCDENEADWIRELRSNLKDGGWINEASTEDIRSTSD